MGKTCCWTSERIASRMTMKMTRNFRLIGHALPTICASWICPAGKEDLLKDKKTLEAVYERVSIITPERDGKLQEIKAHIRDRVQHPTTDKDGRINRKLLVFTTFKDTAEYLDEELGGLGERIGIEHGDGFWGCYAHRFRS